MKKMTQKQWEKFQYKCDDREDCNCPYCDAGSHCNNEYTPEGDCFLMEACPKLNKEIKEKWDNRNG